MEIFGNILKYFEKFRDFEFNEFSLRLRCNLLMNFSQPRRRRRRRRGRRRRRENDALNFSEANGNSEYLASSKIVQNASVTISVMAFSYRPRRRRDCAGL